MEYSQTHKDITFIALNLSQIPIALPLRIFENTKYTIKGKRVKEFNYGGVSDTNPRLS